MVTSFVFTTPNVPYDKIKKIVEYYMDCENIKSILEEFFNNNKSYFKEQTKQYLKTKKR